MAHFAELDINNKVLRVAVGCNIDIANNGGELSEQAARHFENNSPLSENGVKWIQTSYNNNFRKQLAGPNFTYDPIKNIFICPQPFPSWTLDSNNDWQSPVEFPSVVTYGDNFNYRINTLKIIIQHFDNLQKEMRNITDKKRDIISIYYYIIILMPFSLGTSSIAEMFLYSLWKFYIGTRLEIRQTIMLDVEALLNTFDVFYKNCFTNDDKENDPVILRQIYGYDEATYKPITYTPYLVESKLNINLTGFGGLFGLD